MVALLFVLAPEALARLYTNDAEVLRLARPLLALGAAFQLFDALQIVARWRAARRRRHALAVPGPDAPGVGAAAAAGVAVRVPLEGGVVGAWYAEFVFVLALAAVLGWRLRSGAWQAVRI